ncbi:MAG: CBS domain-containing protein [Pseudomonadota bacterium]
MPSELVHECVSTCMTPFLITVGRYTTLGEAYELMMSNRIRRLPVVENQELVGIVTLSDLLAATPITHRPGQLPDGFAAFGRLSVGVAMSHPVVAVYQSDPIGRAAELMMNHKVGGLPVLDAVRSLVGLITESNIFHELARRWRDDNLLFSGARLRNNETGLHNG